MERPFQFSQRQLDAYLASARAAARAFMRAFRRLMPSRCSTTKVHYARCHRLLELTEAGAPSMRSAQHLEAANKSLVRSYQESNKQDLAGLPARASDCMAAQLITDALSAVERGSIERPLGAADSVTRYPAIATQRSFTIAARQLRPATDEERALPDDDEDSALAALTGYARDECGDEGFDPLSTPVSFANVASVVISGRVDRPRLDVTSSRGVYVILGPVASGGPLGLRGLRVARVLFFCSALINGVAKPLAIAEDLVTCSEHAAAPARDRAEARFCRMYAPVMLPVRNALERDFELSHALRFRVLDFAAPGDVLQLGHVMRRAILRPSAPRSGVEHRGDFFLYLGKLLAGATRLPGSEETADWLPTA